MTDIQFWFNQLVSLKLNDRTGNRDGVTVVRKADYMLVETTEGCKETDCVQASQLLAGVKTFAEIKEFANV